MSSEVVGPVDMRGRNALQLGTGQAYVSVDVDVVGLSLQFLAETFEGWPFGGRSCSTWSFRSCWSVCIGSSLGQLLDMD